MFFNPVMLSWTSACSGVLYGMCRFIMLVACMNLLQSCMVPSVWGPYSGRDADTVSESGVDCCTAREVAFVRSFSTGDLTYLGASSSTIGSASIDPLSSIHTYGADSLDCWAEPTQVVVDMPSTTIDSSSQNKWYREATACTQMGCIVVGLGIVLVFSCGYLVVWLSHGVGSV